MRPRLLLAGAAAGVTLAAGAAGVAIGSGDDPPPRAPARAAAAAAAADRTWTFSQPDGSATVRITGPSLADVVTVRGFRCPGGHPSKLGTASSTAITRVDGGPSRRRSTRAVICTR